MHQGESQMDKSHNMVYCHLQVYCSLPEKGVYKSQIYMEV